MSDKRSRGIHSIQVTRLTIRHTRRALMCTLDFKVGHTVHTCFNGWALMCTFFYLKLYLLIHFHIFKMPRSSKGLRGQWTAAMLQNAMTAIHKRDVLTRWLRVSQCPLLVFAPSIPPHRHLVTCVTQSSSTFPHRLKPTDKQPTTNEIIPTTQLHYRYFYHKVNDQYTYCQMCRILYQSNGKHFFSKLS